ncbi:MAG: HD domain-containing protein [Lachnospiraceae bacterium]|nr:HD domain-containing protein [Lachnospiraceae bacterium]
MQLPRAVAAVLRLLEEAGHEAYAVGGCVRDSLLGKEPKDWDVTTSALPQEVKAVFHRTLDTGIKHGTVTVRIFGESIEVTTFRVDGVYEDGRHPKDVVFTPSLAEDLARRDFTINAMAYAPRRGIVDLYGGREDLARGIVRAVGEPRERFTEDALRILRALRFAARLDFDIEEKTFAAMKELSPRLSLISAERIREELTGLLTSPHPERFAQVREIGADKVILPEWEEIAGVPQNNRFHCYPVDEHILATLPHVPPEPYLRWTMLLHDIGKGRTHTVDEDGHDHFYGHGKVSAQMAEEILRRLRFDNDTIDRVRTLILWHDFHFDGTPASVRRGLAKVGEDLFEPLLQVMRADTLGKDAAGQAFYLAAIGQVRAQHAQILAEGNCVTLKDLAVTGNDLIAAGEKPGKHLGEVLGALLEAVLEDPSLNEKEKLLALYGGMREKE